MITNEYNKYVDEYLNNNTNINVLFSFINDKNVELILNKYTSIKEYYSFIELISTYNLDDVNVIDYYDTTNYISTGTNRFFGNKINKHIKNINHDMLFTWNDYINNHRCFFDTTIKEYNYPLV